MRLFFALVLASACALVNLGGAPARAAEPAPPAAPPLPATPELRAADLGELVVLRGAPAQNAPCPPALPPGAALPMVTPRGGYASALAVVRGQKLEQLAATLSPLQGPGGSLPAASVQLRWLTGQPFALIFSDKPVEAQIQPLLVTVHAPEQAAPGTYTGKLSVTGAGFSGSLDVKLEVTPWRLPAPRDWPMLTGFVHSPDTVALQYNVEPWSDAHLKLLEPSLRLLKDLGSESCYLFLIAEALIYERYSIVRWRDGKPDFACVDKYLDLWQKVCGPAKKLTLHVWEGNRQPHLNATNSVKVTRIAANGQLENFRAPYYDTPEAPAFWKPVFDGLRERLAKRGWRDTEVLLGVPWDCHPSEEAITFFKTVAPGWRWRVFTHGFNIPLPQADGKLVFPCGAEVGWIEGTGPMGYGQMAGKHPGLIRSAMMKRAYPFTISCRAQVQSGAQNWVWRDAPASSVGGGNQGLSQVGLDYWPLNFDGKPRPPGLGAGCLIQIGFGGFNPRHELANSITIPGPGGAEPTLHYELLREGLQAAAALQTVRETGKNGDAKAAAAATAFDAFMQTRLQNCHGVIVNGKVVDWEPATLIYPHVYDPNGLRACIEDARKTRPGQRLTVAACYVGKDPAQCAAIGGVVGTADAVVITDSPRQPPNFEELAAKIRAAVPAGKPCEVVRDRTQALRRARELAGKTGTVALIGWGGEGPFPALVQDRSQDKWNAAVRELYQAAAQVK